MARSLIGFGLVIAMFCSACGDDGDHRYRNDYVKDTSANANTCGSGDVRRATIDTGEGVDANPGDGVGVFLEYQAGGHWHLTLSCDTATSGQSCGFDVLVEVAGGSSFTDLSPDGLEADDQVSFTGDGRLDIITDTASDFDGVWFDTDPGSVVSVDALLDSDCANQFVFWIGDGAVHTGAPSTPFELEPSAP